LSREDVAGLLKFVTAQVVRTDAPRRFMDQQAVREVDSTIFVRYAGQKMRIILDVWGSAVPSVVLYRSMTIGSLFITGDDPVITFADDPIKSIETPFDAHCIAHIETFLKHRNSSFLLPISPYFCVAVLNNGKGTVTGLPDLDSVWVPKIDEYICPPAVQFIAARDESSLAFYRKNAA
jgi:hypothetical protein